jgi:hypothetical protein
MDAAERCRERPFSRMTNPQTRQKIIKSVPAAIAGELFPAVFLLPLTQPPFHLFTIFSQFLNGSLASIKQKPHSRPFSAGGILLHRISRVVSRYLLAGTIGAIGVTIAVAALAQSQSPTVLPARTSWLGNTYGNGNGTWMQINVMAIAVTPDGRVFTNTPWDESGAEVSLYKDGKVLGTAGGTHGWGHHGGRAVALNGRYLFAGVTVDNERNHLQKPGVWPPAGKDWFGVSRRQIGDLKKVAPFQPGTGAPADPNVQAATAFLQINEVPQKKREEAKLDHVTADVGGLAATDSVLYVANTLMNRIEMVDAESMQPKGSWDAPQPGRLALGPDGSLWALLDSAGAAPRLAHFTAKGEAINDAPVLPKETQAVDLTVDNKGRLLIADNGPRQQVLYFTRDGGGANNAYRESGALGERGGIFAGVAGRTGPQRFNGLTGVGVDAAGNIYVSCNGMGPQLGGTGAGLGATLESYAPDGRELWQLQGLLFVDGAWVDPSRPNSVYTGNKRFELDLSKPAGQESKYVAFLSGRFKYPEDPVFYLDDWPGLPMARKLDGRTFLFLTDMYSDHLKIYRFDAKRSGELAIPSGYFASRERGSKRIPNSPANNDWIWRDNNGDARFDADEFSVNRSSLPNPGGWGWWVDTKGDIWHTSDKRGINRFRYGGLDRFGNPIYSYENAQNYPMPAPFTEVKRAIYEADTDTMYLTGYTAEEPYDNAFWKEVGRRLVRYDHWSTEPRQRYSIALPWQTKAPIATTISMTVEGKYVFTVESLGLTLHVYDKDTGREVGVMKPGPEVGATSGWVDVPNGISASRQPDGEYLVFVEEDARGKVTMYRWKP